MRTKKASSVWFFFVAAPRCWVGVRAADTAAAKAPPAFFVQDPTDSLCLSGEEFKRCSIDTLFYVLGEPGQSVQSVGQCRALAPFRGR